MPGRLICQDFDKAFVTGHMHSEMREAINLAIEKENNPNLYRQMTEGFKTIGMEATVLRLDINHPVRQAYHQVVQDFTKKIKAQPQLQEVYQAALKNGDHIAITSFSYFPQAIQSVVQGLDLGEFSPSQIHIVAGFPCGTSKNPRTSVVTGIGDPGSPDAKNQHIALAKAHFGVTKNHKVTLVDDTVNNNIVARNHGYNAVDVSPDPNATSHVKALSLFISKKRGVFSKIKRKFFKDKPLHISVDIHERAGLNTQQQPYAQPQQYWQQQPNAQQQQYLHAQQQLYEQQPQSEFDNMYAEQYSGADGNPPQRHVEDDQNAQQWLRVNEFMDRQQAEAELAKGAVGDYVVRKSTLGDNFCAISMKISDNEINHFIADRNISQGLFVEVPGEEWRHYKNLEHLVSSCCKPSVEDLQAQQQENAQSRQQQSELANQDAAAARKRPLPKTPEETQAAPSSTAPPILYTALPAKPPVIYDRQILGHEVDKPESGRNPIVGAGAYKRDQANSGDKPKLSSHGQSAQLENDGSELAAALAKRRNR